MLVVYLPPYIDLYIFDLHDLYLQSFLFVCNFFLFFCVVLFFWFRLFAVLFIIYINHINLYNVLGINVVFKQKRVKLGLP
jgi:hypothetical protein